MSALNAPSYTATRKGRALRVAPQVAAPAAESAVYDCLVTEVKQLVGVLADRQRER